DEVFRSENGKGPWGRERARERYGGPLLSTGTSRAQGDEGSRKDLAGDGRTHGTGIRREPGEGSTESARPINTQFPAPPTSGAGKYPSRGAVHIAAGGPGRLQEGWPDALSRRAATKETLACRRGRILGARGCRETPPVRSALSELMDTELMSTDSSLVPPATLDGWVVPPHTLSRRSRGRGRDRRGNAMTQQLVDLVEQFCQYQLKQRGKTE